MEYPSGKIDATSSDIREGEKSGASSFSLKVAGFPSHSVPFLTGADAGVDIGMGTVVADAAFGT